MYQIRKLYDQSWLPQPTPTSEIELGSPKWLSKYFVISRSAMSSLVNGMTGLQQISIQGTPGSKAWLRYDIVWLWERPFSNLTNACGPCVCYSGSSCFSMAYAGDPLGLALGTSLFVAVAPMYIPNYLFGFPPFWGHDATIYLESDEEGCIGDIGAPLPAFLSILCSKMAQTYHRAGR